LPPEEIDMNIAFVRLLVAGAAAWLALPAQAAGDLSRQEPVALTVQLGTPDGEHRFTPDTIRLETGRLYRLRLENPSSHHYYFYSAGLADSIYSRKVAVLDRDGAVLAEVYGPVRRIEVKAGAAAEWWFVPVRSGTFDDLMSTKRLAEAGMRGRVQID
jgi:hypothetical protein